MQPYAVVKLAPNTGSGSLSFGIWRRGCLRGRFADLDGLGVDVGHPVVHLPRHGDPVRQDQDLGAFQPVQPLLKSWEAKEMASDGR